LVDVLSKHGRRAELMDDVAALGALSDVVRADHAALRVEGPTHGRGGLLGAPTLSADPRDKTMTFDPLHGV
jgi:hypothetical protein